MASLSEASLPLSGLLNIQKDYLNDLGQISQNNKNVAGDLLDLRNRLEKIHASFIAADTSADKTLTHQTKVEDILEKEHERLLSRKDEIDNIHYGKMRAVRLNDSYRKRQSDYLRILVAVIIAILVYIAVAFIVPEPLKSILVVTLFVVVVFYVVSVVWEIYRRDNMDHDRLDLQPPNGAMSGDRAFSATSAATAAAAAAASGPVCTGEVCCSDGSRWDASMNKCIFSCTDPAKPITKGTTCIAETECSAPFKRCGNACIYEETACGVTTNAFSTLGEERIRTKSRGDARPYSPYEYDSYAPAM